MQQNNNYMSNVDKDLDTLNFRAELEKYFRHWKWFVLAITLSVAGAHLYLRYTTPIFNTQATILLNDEKGNSGFSELSALEDLGIFLTSSPFFNQ